MEADPRRMLEAVVRSLVDVPDAVRVDATESNGTLRFTVVVDAGDLSKLQGRSAQTLRALRTILAPSASKLGYTADQLWIETAPQSN